MLPASLALKSFEMISRRRGQIAQFHGAIQLPQFPASYLLEQGEPQDTFAAMELLGVAAAEGPDHTAIV